MAILFLILVTLAIIALVLAVVAMKLIRKPLGTAAAPVSPPPATVPVSSGTGASKVEPKTAAPSVKSSKPASVPRRSDGEMESFDISVNASKVLWTCPACGAENSYGDRCQICAANRV